MIEMNVSTSVDSNLKIISYKNCQTIVLYTVTINRNMADFLISSNIFQHGYGQEKANNQTINV